MKWRAIQIGLPLVAIGLMGWFTVHQLSRSENRREEHARDIERMEKTLELLEAKQKASTALVTRLAEIRQSVLNLESRWPGIVDQQRLLNELRQFADANSMQIQSVQSIGGTGSMTSAERPVIVNMHGDFYGFYGFLQQIEQLPHAMRISRLNLGSEGNGAMTAELMFNVRFQPGTATQVATIGK
jgi:Tfp pilus assembly protein PilO